MGLVDRQFLDQCIDIVAGHRVRMSLSGIMVSPPSRGLGIDMARRHNVCENPTESDIIRLHETMISEQIVGRGITARRTIEAMRAVPRHSFLPQALWGHAYDDRPQSIGFHQTISQPYIVSLMTSQFESLPEGSRILEVGSGCGYQTALLVQMGFEVHAIEIVQQLAKRSEVTLKQLDLSPVSMRSGDGKMGLPDEAPFSGVLAAACARELPLTWIDQLGAPGILVAPVVREDSQILVRVDKVAEGVEPTRNSIASVRFVELM